MQTSNQAAFLLYCMAVNPEAQERLYEEIKSVVGERAQPTPEDLSKMPYLKGCVMESFRWEDGLIIVQIIIVYTINFLKEFNTNLSSCPL